MSSIGACGTRESGRLELISLFPANCFRLARRLPPGGEAEPRHCGIASEIHVRMIFVAWLVVVLGGVFVRLLQAPRLVMPLVLHPFINRERRNSHTRQAEVIGTVVVSGLRPRVGTNGQPEFLRQGLDGRIERGALGARDLYFLR